MRHRSSARIRRGLLIALLCAPGALPAAPPAAAAEAPEASGALAALEGRWVEMRGPEFVFVSDGGKMSTAGLADRLATFRNVVVALSNARHFEPRLPTTVYVFSRLSDYRRLTGRSAQTPGFFVPSASGNVLAMLDRSAEGQVILLHEYAHFLVRNQATFRPPLWYSEGFADFVAPTGVGASMVLGGPNPMRLPGANGARLLPLRDVLGARRYADLPPDAFGDFYKTSWILVHYLHMRRRDEMLRFLDRYSRGELSSAAPDTAFGVPLPQLERELDEYWQRFVRTGRLPALRLDEARYRAVARVETTELSAAAAAVRLAELALAFGRPGKAEPLIDAVLARDPDTARARAILAAVRLAEEDWDGAESHGLRAVKLDPASLAGHLAIGNALLAVLAATEGAGESFPLEERREQLSRARRHFERSIALAPEQPAGHLGLARSHLYDDGDPSPGLAAAGRARDLLGSDNQVLFLQGALELRAGHPERASALLEEVIAWDHHGGFGDEAQKLLDGLEPEAQGEGE